MKPDFYIFNFFKIKIRTEIEKDLQKKKMKRPKRLNPNKKFELEKHNQLNQNEIEQFSNRELEYKLRNIVKDFDDGIYDTVSSQTLWLLFKESKRRYQFYSVFCATIIGKVASKEPG